MPKSLLAGTSWAGHEDQSPAHDVVPDWQPVPAETTVRKPSPRPRATTEKV